MWLKTTGPVLFRTWRLETMLGVSSVLFGDGTVVFVVFISVVFFVVVVRCFYCC